MALVTLNSTTVYMCPAARPSAADLLNHPWFRLSSATADAAELEGAASASGNMRHVVARLEAFAGMSRMKRLALVVLCHTVTDRHISRLKVSITVGNNSRFALLR